MSSLGELRTIARSSKRRSSADGPTIKVKEKYPDNVAGYLFLLPWLIGLVVFTVGPMVASLYLSFTDYNLLEAAKWVGWDNYTKLFTVAGALTASRAMTMLPSDVSSVAV